MDKNNIVKHPWIKLSELLSELNISQEHLSIKLWVSLSKINDLINWKINITYRWAFLLGYFFEDLVDYRDYTSEKWISLQRDYDKNDSSNSDMSKLKTELELRKKYAEKIPLTDLIKKWWLKNFSDFWLIIKDLEQLIWVSNLPTSLDNFNLDHVLKNATNNIAFKRTINPNLTDDFNIALWMTIWSIKSKEIKIWSVYDQEKVKVVVKNIHQYIINTDHWVEQVIKDLKEAWVKVLIMSNLVKTRVDWAVKRDIEDGNDCPTIFLTLRYNKIDSFWFNLCHELWHIILHKNKFTSWFSVNLNNWSEWIWMTDDEEREANNYARNMLIDDWNWFEFVIGGNFKEESIEWFAESVWVDSSIVVWRLKFEWYIPYYVHWNLSNKKVSHLIPKDIVLKGQYVK